jgi:lysozyme
MMEISTEGLELVKRSEGFSGQVYKDVAGWPTIGYGHKLVVGESFPDGITEVQATTLLLSDVATAEKAISRLVKVALTQGQFDALVDFVFNLGAGRLANSTLLRYLNAGAYANAGLQLMLWDHAGGEEVAGLKARRQAELQLWKGANISAPSNVV